MKIKDGVLLSGLQLEMRNVLIVADNVCKEFGNEMVVTCGLDGTHSPGSFHYYGYAIDIRTRFFSPNEVREVHNAIDDSLGNYSIYYQVITHETHIHIEFDIIKYKANMGV